MPAANDDQPVDLTEVYTGDLARYTYWLTIATTMTALVAAISLAITVWIASSTNDLKHAATSQLEEMRKSAEQVERSIRASTDQVGEMKSANQIATSSQVIQMRAYLVLEAHDVDERPSKDIKVGYRIKNVGQTPAYVVTSYKNERFVFLSPDGQFDSPGMFQTGPDKNDNPEPDIMGAGIVVRYNLSRTDGKTYPAAYTDDELKDFKADKKVLIFWGVVYYRDIFQNDRYMRFCRYFKSGNTKDWYSCRNHNDAN